MSMETCAIWVSSGILAVDSVYLCDSVSIWVSFRGYIFTKRFLGGLLFRLNM